MVKLPEASATIPKDTIVDGTFAERVTALICLLAAAAGVTITLSGAWQAGLETRGRLQLKLPEPTPAGLDRGPEAEVLEGVAKILDQARRLRGTIAVIAAGALLVGLAMLFASLWVTSKAPAPSPSASATTSASQSPTAEPSPPAATEPATTESASAEPSPPAPSPSSTGQ